MRTILLLLASFFVLNVSAQKIQPSATGDSSQVFSYAEEMPVFPGGETAFMEYLSKNIHYPQLEKESNKQGTVYISFVIEKDGSVSNVHAIKEVPGAPGLTKEAIRVLSAMPNWNPGKMNGRPVRVSVAQPVRFVLQGGTTIPDCGPALSNSAQVLEAHPGRLPEYPGGDSAMNLHAKNIALQHKKQFADMSDKTILISFVVNRDGKVEDVVIADRRGTSKEIALIAAEMFCSMPQWTPGGSGLLSSTKHSNVNLRMKAEVYLGKYSKKKMLTAPKIALLPVPMPPPPPPRSVQPPRDVNVQPQFNGGDSALAKFIDTYLLYPKRAKDAGIEGTVIVSFIVSQDGRVTYAYVSEEVAGAPELSQEALRLVNMMPPWVPGSIKGVTSQMMVKLPIKFELKK